MNVKPVCVFGVTTTKKQKTVCLTNVKKLMVMFEKYKQEFDTRVLTRKEKVLPF